MRAVMGRRRAAGHPLGAGRAEKKTKMISRRLLAARISATSIALSVGLAVWALANSYLSA
jgi:hypothetical protein